MVALNMAWVKRWRKQNSTIPSLNDDIINPNWLMVDRAIVSFISFFVIAHEAAIFMVRGPTIINVVLNRGNSDRNLYERISRYTPAVTSVEE